jgi:nicotinate phosphoribosyltransferase
LAFAANLFPFFPFPHFLRDATALFTMKKPAIIQSLLDTDLYKFTMLQTVLHQFPAAHGQYQFRCRNRPERPLSFYVNEIKEEIDALCQLSFSVEELAYLRSLRFIKSDFVDYLELFKLKRRFIDVQVADEQLIINIEGPVIQAMFFEIFVLAIINEVYFRHSPNLPATLAEGERRLDNKIQRLKNFANENKSLARYPLRISDFGTRRRFSREWHRYVVERLASDLPDFFKGTSNVYLAWQLQLVPIGTMAHEFLQSFQALGVRLRDFQKAALEAWVQEYRGDLGVALTDVISMDAFLTDFDLYFAKLFDGLRHDSGDPYVWGDKAIAHYETLRIDPSTKMLTFSDGLDIDKVLSLYHYFSHKIPVAFGVGTNLTNDMGLEALQIVIKMTHCNGQSVAKLSDAAGKTMCTDDTFLAYLRQVFQVEAP